jgi:hypothetical protein
LTALRPEYRLCRMFRAHALEGFVPDRRTYTAPDWGTTFHFLCTRCGAQRHDTIDALGELGARRYVYPKDYQLTADERPTTQELRLIYADDLKSARTKRAAARAKRRKATG